jgi:hypothetical protein
MNTVGQQRVFVSDFCGEDLANFHFARHIHNAIILPSDMAKTNAQKELSMAATKGHRGLDHLRDAWLLSLVAAALVVLGFLLLAGQMVPDYGADLVDGLYDPIATIQATVPAGSSPSDATASSPAPAK